MLPPKPTTRIIQETQEPWGLTFDDERQAILQPLNTADIRACPGSGKTTLLVVKLGLLAQQWTSKHTGICVLSHTNAARREIEQQLGKHTALNALMRYPHFVGTIQTFMHQFLASPAAIERFGTRPHIVDNDHYTNEAKRHFYEGTRTNEGLYGARYAISRWIEDNPGYENAGDFVSTLEYLDDQLSLRPLGTKKKPVSWDTATGHALRQHKEEISRQGIFRYQDMAALAARHAKQHPGLAAIISHRFPIVLIDEMQDTIEEQADLISHLFDGRSVVQRFGDDRQAIYHSPNTNEPGARFPEGNQLPMKKSFRLSPSIARLARHVCADKHPEDLIGDQNKPDRQHTIFVFTRETIDKVLPSFAELVTQELGPTTKDEVKAVGANTKAKPEENKFPSAVPDYWDNYEAPHKKNKQRITCLAGALTQARTELTTRRSTGEARNTLLTAAARLLSLQGVNDEGRPLNPAKLVRLLRKEHPEHHQKLAEHLVTTIQALAQGTPPDSEHTGDTLKNILSPLLDDNWNDEAINFCTQAPEEQTTPDPAQDCINDQNVYQRETTHSRVEVTIGTIHSVKGQTLRAILILETFNRSHDLQQLVERGPLKGTAAKKLGKQFEEHLRRVFVGMTRPTELLCLAVLDEHLNTNDRTALETLGWTITTV